MKQFVLLAALALSACSPPLPPTDVTAGDLPPIAHDYRASIVAWTKRFYEEPASLRGVSISDPVLTRDSHGRLVWLVCFEGEARGRDGGYLGSEREAFGFAPNYVSAPLERRGSSLSRQDCDIRPLVFRPWRDFPTLARAPSHRSARRG